MLNDSAGMTASQTSSEAVRKSEELLRAVFNASAELICVSTIFGIFVEANDAFCAACGRTREEIIGQPGTAIILWVDLARRHEFLEMLGRDGFVSCFEADMRHENGEVRQCLLSARVVKVAGAPLVVTRAKDVSGTCAGF
jgi:PAS domain S-box-containing protein